MLKALEIVGFKSFADKTRFEFPAGITVIVGPNGSGKSNIVDAMKWVLGEQSAKSLRGKDMADVIFKGGGGGRKPMNMAEATIIFDNSGGQLPTDAPEVHVTRRVYRSGEGEYLINRQPCRLKDIRDLFRGTGVGVDAYSLIEQGKVDRLLQASPKDRRAIFEEAAGISRFKAKKIEAQRRLERVDQNLLRLRDIVEEVESRLKTVRAQASKAQRYREYSQRLQELRTQVGMVDWRALSARLAEIESCLDALREEIAARSAELEKHEARALELETDLTTAGDDLRAAEGSYAKNREQIAALESQIGHQRARACELEEEAGRLRHNIVSMTTRVVDSQARLRDTLAELESAGSAHAEVVAALSALEAALTELTSRLDRLRKRGEEQRQRHGEQLRAAAHLGSQVGALQTQQASAQLTIQRCQARWEELAQSVTEAEGELDQERAQEVDFVQAIAGRTAELEEARKALDAERRLQERRQADLTETHAKLRAVKARASLLEELENNFEGLASGVKELLQAKDADAAGPLADIRGVVADFIRAPVEWAALIDAALGPTSQYVVIEGDRLVAALTAGEVELPGRVGLVQLNTHAATFATAESDLASQAGVIGRADQLVEADATNVDLVGRLLSRTWLVETLADAYRLLANYPGRRFCFVTKGGEVLAADGVLFAGAGTAGHGLISRRSELRAIKLELVAIGNQITAQQAELERIALRVAGHEREVAEFVAQQQQDEKALAEVRYRQRALEERREQLRRQQATLATDEAMATAQQRELAKQLAEQQGALALAEQAVVDLEQALAQNRAELDDIAANRDAQVKEVTTQRIALAKSEQRLEALRARREQLEEDQRERERISTDAQSQLAQALERARQAEFSILQATSQVAELYLRKEVLARETVAVMERQHALIGERQTLADALARIRRQQRKAEDSQHEQELAAHEVRHERQTLADRLRDDYGIDLAALPAPQAAPVVPAPKVVHPLDAGDEDAAVEAPPLDVSEEEQRAGVEEEIATLRRKISNIGAVNMDALGELDDLEARFANLSGQYNDLAQAKESLERIIIKINNDSRRLFIETLEAIRTNFQALYRKAFGGGKADIVLEENVDILEAGVDIIATPPGKPSFSNSLLSGGEKALTAVALLLAIFQFRPSPFCVLDEVDAPFDEANIGRFVDVLKEFLGWTKFVIVTHSKKTMTAATTLYGVTMQESGVSKRVSVRFEDVSEDGHISQEAAQRDSAEESAA
jgi:chromosome segregation protein